MGDLSKNTSRWEYACRCSCGLSEPHPDLAVGVQEVRDILGVPVTISSGCRCREHNKEKGGKDGSYHLPGAGGYCRAADLLMDVPLLELYTACCAVPAFRGGGVGVYFDSDGPRVHVDVRGWFARWGRLYGRDAEIIEVLAAAS